MRPLFRIGELAGRAGCTVETIRYYERAGLLTEPRRSEGNYRLYDETQLDRLSFVLRCRSLDMTLDEIRTLLLFCDAPSGSCEGVNDLLDAHIAHVAARVAELGRLEKQLKNLRRQCGKAQQAKDCGILQSLTHRQAPVRNAGSRTDTIRGSH